MSTNRTEGLPGARGDFTGWRREFNPVVQRTRELRDLTNNEMKALVNDGAVVYELDSTSTIAFQEEGQREKQKPAFWGFPPRSSQLVEKVPSLSRVAIYPDPKRFFIDNSGSKSVVEKQKLAYQDGEELRKRLRINAAVVIPKEASVLTGIAFQHFDKTGKWLFGYDYAYYHGLDWVYGVTTNSIYRESPDVAVVGDAWHDAGLRVSSWDPNHGNERILAVRLIVGQSFSYTTVGSPARSYSAGAK